MSSDFDINLAISPLRIISVMMMYRLGTRQGRCHRLWLDPPVRPPRLADLEHRPHLLFDRPPQPHDGRATLAVGILHISARRAPDYRATSLLKCHAKSLPQLHVGNAAARSRTVSAVPFRPNLHIIAESALTQREVPRLSRRE